jgi:SAM-dependent methyltransferase
MDLIGFKGLSFYYDYYERILRRWYGIEYPRLENNLFKTNQEALHADGHANIGSDILPFYHGLRQAKIKPNQSVFIDYGCGTGKITTLAAILNFKKTIGIDLDEEGLTIAKRNAARIKGAIVELHKIDASNYTVPDDVNVIYFFNPFGKATMQQVIIKIKESHLRLPRKITILYQHPIESELLENAGFLKTYEYFLPTGVSYYSNWLVQ